MNDTQMDPEQWASEHMAQTLAGTDGARVVRLLELTGQLAATSAGADGAGDSERPEARTSMAPRRIGVWELSDRGAYHRSQTKQSEWGLWAQRESIPLRKSGRRILLLGESVARGYLYDPMFNVAAALEGALRACLDTRMEVVDLACTNQTLPELERVFEASFDLEPDAIVIFAGNNWWHSVADVRSPADRLARLAGLGAAGIPGLLRACEGQLAKDVESFVDLVGRRSEAQRVPIVIVIPDYNLADWRDSAPVVPWLTNGRNGRWQECAREARAALAAGDWDLAESSAQELVELDGGTVPFGLRLLGECKQRAGDLAGARALYERSRDSSLWNAVVPSSPRCFSIVQRTLREGALKHGLTTVDLRQVFDRHLGGSIPGRRIFLDYCHLSVEGIRVTTAATVVALAEVLRYPVPSKARLANAHVPIDPEVEAQAHFIAAIHNAHWSCDSEEVIEHHARLALEKHPPIAELMRDYMEMGTRAAPGWMCGAVSRMLAQAKNPAFLRYVIGMFASKPKVLDEALFGVLSRCLGNAKELDELRVREHGSSLSLNLLAPSASLEAVSRREGFWLVRGRHVRWPGYFRAYEPESRFVFVRDEATPVELQIVARSAPGEDEVRRPFKLRLNGAIIFEAELSAKWTEWKTRVEEALVRAGKNEVVIHWPPAAGSARAALKRAADALLFEEIPEYYPVFGEMHAFNCTDSRRHAASLAGS